MRGNAVYWKNKDAARAKAIRHSEIAEKLFADEIAECERNASIYSLTDTERSGMSDKVKMILDNTMQVKSGDSIEVCAYTSTEAIYNLSEGKTCVLNFASNSNPGGLFIMGSMAQEESLCHESYLFNVLRRFHGEYYAWNDAHKNKGMYMDRGIYIPNMGFFEQIGCSKITHCDVITCAAPNWSVGKRYGKFTYEENKEALVYRILFVLDMAQKNHVDTLILGAFGCGVFKNNPADVATLFGRALRLPEYTFKKVFFAIPERADGNLGVFKSVLKG